MIVVRQVLGLATVQDLGRAGYASQGVPPSGVLVRALAHAANAAAGNDAGAPCVEIFGRFACVADAAVDVADDRGALFSLRAGDELVIAPDPERRVRYLALAGGVSAPLVLGSRSVLASCGIGRALRRGDRIETASAEIRARALQPPLEGDAIRVVLGPDAPDAGEALLRAPFRISTTSDRTGTRLESDAPITIASNDALPSSPTVVGAIQLPRGGAPIVIGPDGPTTGGYPIIAVVVRADLDRFHGLPLGARVVFVRAGAP